MPDFLGSTVAGAIGGAVAGILVILGERFLFSAPAAWSNVARSYRFIRYRYQAARGQSVSVCVQCYAPEPLPVVDMSVLPGDWEEAPPGTRWLRCSNCGHVWGMRNIIAAILPVTERPADK